MTNLYITSAETFSGKSSVSIGLGLHLQADGLKVGYMKPVNVDSELREGLPFDPDVAFAKESFSMPEPLAKLGPVTLTPAKLEQQLRGQAIDYEPVFMDAFNQVSTGRDVVVLEGGRSWREGYIAGLPPKLVVEKTGSQVLLVLKYDDTLLVDRALAAQDYFGQALIGMVINKIPSVFRDHLNDTILPYLVRHNLKVLGLLPQDTMLAAPSVAELAEEGVGEAWSVTRLPSFGAVGLDLAEERLHPTDVSLVFAPHVEPVHDRNIAVHPLQVADAVMQLDSRRQRFLVAGQPRQQVLTRLDGRLWFVEEIHGPLGLQS